MNKNLPEYIGVKTAVIAGQAGARIAAGLSDRIGVLVYAGVAANITLNQHTAASGGTSKVLATDNISYNKIAANDVFAKVKPEPGVTASVYAVAVGLFYIEVESSQLDTNAGFSHFSITSDANVTAFYMLVDGRKGPFYSIAI